jgi:Zn-dependent peptidase ImmA (M78 family)
LERVAAETEIGPSSLSEFENGKREPKFSQLNRLAELYRRSVDFFLSNDPLAEDMMLWRDAPAEKDQIKRTEAEFRQLCDQYHKLEVLTGESKAVSLPQAQGSREAFSFKEASRLAENFQEQFLRGEIPSTSIRHVLEEKFHVKIFHLPIAGSAVSTLSSEFGPAVLLNSQSKLWRRNFDLAHEVFHLLTWSIFRDPGCQSASASEHEEKLANAFASRLLLPTDAVRDRIEDRVDDRGQISFEALDEIAREFGVSLDALLWRLLYLYHTPVDSIRDYLDKAGHMRLIRPARQSDEPDRLPERYCGLAIRALREGRLSLTQFAKYMGLSYKKAEEYLADEGELTDEEISIPIA